MNLFLNISIIIFSFAVIYVFAKKASDSYLDVEEQIAEETEFYTEVILGLESAGRNVSRPNSLERAVRIAIWELYNNLRVQPQKENKSIVLHRKILEKKQILYKNLEEARVNVEILPFLGIIGTLLGFAIPYLFKVTTTVRFSFQVSGLGFFLAASSTICALLALVYLKKRFESTILARFDYYESQQVALEKIMIHANGFSIFESWLGSWSEESLLQEKSVDS